MKAYLSPEQAESGAIPIESWAGVYRDPDNGQQIAVETEATVSHLGIADVTVSRKQGDGPPVVFRSQSESIEVRNQGNSNGVTVRTKSDTTEVSEGFSARISRDATIELGYQTTLQLTVEREARVEVQNGDYVAGDKSEVTDSVLNRSNVGGDQSGDAQPGQSQSGRVEDSAVNRSDVTGKVEDSVVNRSTVGSDTSGDGGPANEDVADQSTGADTTEQSDDQSTTRNVCQVHGIAYTGQTCPKCAAAESGGETKYCLYCGESIPEQARVCPQCGEELPSQ